MRRLAIGCVLLALCSGSFGQTPQPAQQPATLPEFEVAVLKLNVSGRSLTRPSTPAEERNGELRQTNIPLSQLFRVAFNVGKGAPTIVGAPAWFETDRWDILAKMPPDTPDTPTDNAARITRMRLAVQSFLTRELKLATHTERRPLNVYALTVGKGGPNLQTGVDTRAPSTCTAVGAPAGSVGSHRECKNLSMDDLVRYLPLAAPAYFGDTQVVDQTGLTGAYNFNLDWVPLNQVDVDGVGGLTIFGAVEKLGLKLKLEKLPMPVMVIDHMERPAQN